MRKTNMERVVARAARETARWMASSGWHRKIGRSGEYAQDAADRMVSKLEQRWGREIVRVSIREWENKRRGRRSSVRKLSRYIGPELPGPLCTIEDIIGLREVAQRMWRDIPSGSYGISRGIAPSKLYTASGEALSAVIQGTLGDLSDAIDALEACLEPDDGHI